MALVFQYGIQTHQRRGLIQLIDLMGMQNLLALRIQLKNTSLIFTVWSNGNNCAAADIVPGGTRQIWGVLYEVPDYLIDRITAGKRKSFDAIEGQRYRRQKIQVCMANEPQKPITVWTYTVIDKTEGLRTSYEYAAHILAGLQEHDAPEDYLDYVKGRIKNNNPDIRGSMFDKMRSKFHAW